MLTNDSVRLGGAQDSDARSSSSSLINFEGRADSLPICMTLQGKVPYGCFLTSYRTFLTDGPDKESSGTARKASSTPFFLTEQEQQLNQVEKLKLQLQMMTNDRNELRDFLAHYNNELNNRLNSDHEMQNTEHKMDMADVMKLPKEISEALYKCTELSEKTKIYR
ncbi:disks large homolog 5-like [Peromyscus maniculatus bairdii]|uniref:disks large homolog 5-like n=1 Tax=Peromyscus maniculatus bairdii TaxID=230844 RepID=UPI003FCF14F5